MTATAGANGQTPRAITRELAAYAAHARFADLPEAVRIEAARAFVNWMGCVLGGCREPAVAIAAATVAESGGREEASIIGRGRRTDAASAAFVNCISSSVQAYDDAHLATVTHPSGPAGASLFALSEGRAISGESFLTAFALSLEIQCRIANLLLLPPSTFNLGFYVTGLSGPVGVAAAAGNLLGLDEQKINWAIGLGASQASGFRATHGTMTAHFRPGHATRCGVWAALLAANGFDSAEDALEADKGFVDVYSSGADLSRAVDGLGQRFELLTNAYKPYPCGIVIHPTIDACLELREQLAGNLDRVRITLRVHPLALKLTGVRTPTTPLESHISLYHWAAVALLRGTAGLPETQIACIADDAVSALRARIEAVPDPSIAPGEAITEVERADGSRLRAHIKHARGSAARPMTDHEIDAKFRSQARMALDDARVEALLRLCRGVAALRDVGREIAGVWN